MGLRGRVMIPTEKERRSEWRGRAWKEHDGVNEVETDRDGKLRGGFVLQRAPAAFQAGLTPCPMGSLAAGEGWRASIKSTAVSPSRLVLSWPLSVLLLLLLFLPPAPRSSIVLANRFPVCLARGCGNAQTTPSASSLIHRYCRSRAAAWISRDCPCDTVAGAGSS